MYGFDYLRSRTNDQFALLLEAWYESDPLAHAMAMWAKLADSFPFARVYTNVVGGDQADRLSWQLSFKLRFIRAGILVWKFMVNIDPAMVDIYKMRAFEEWKMMVLKNQAVIDALEPFDCVERVPVHELGHRYDFKSEVRQSYRPCLQ